MSTQELIEARPSPEEAIGEMIRCGITRVRVDYFHFREFRYTNFDALAEAKPMLNGIVNVENALDGAGFCFCVRRR
jgi:hypothetical protein